ncbi:J domain-containing protein [Salinivibrio sp. ES.052]|uniref:J domain-containing protein n=1 Tax=Salinivibrio sp. ES.052 TaxID=1882823 RepID=UPI0009294E70|nr:J domain-containing protein [Salinivibrio sp. ES.052]SIN84238.1 DnaJ domain-containing protein [Salinivibrio sp. ES.052]
MITWNELLGVNVGESAEQIKQRYKRLSSRVHPDKGGSTGLMQLVSEAYQAIKAGKGDTSALGQSQREGSQAALRSQIARLQKELAALQQENRMLKSRQSSQQIPAHLTAKIAKLEFDNRQWREHCQKLERQHQSLEGQHQSLKREHEQRKKDAIQLNRELKEALTRVEQLETELTHKATPVTLKPAKPGLSWRWVLASWLIAAVAMLPIGSWQHWIDRLLGQEQPDTTQRVRIIDPDPPAAEPATALTAIQPKSEPPPAIPAAPMIQLTPTANQWHIDQYAETAQPYLALRSEQGSYVVVNCMGDFYVYLNRGYQPLRVPPNLDYVAQRQHFHVYAIPYGQGASIDSWQLARKVQIFDDTFVSAELAPQLTAFEQSCRQTPGLTAVNL